MLQDMGDHIIKLFEIITNKNRQNLSSIYVPVYVHELFMNSSLWKRQCTYCKWQQVLSLAQAEVLMQVPSQVQYLLYLSIID